MKGKLVLISALALLMLFLMILPVLAAPKEKVDFALYIRGSTPSGAWLHANGYLKVSPDKLYPPNSVPPPPPPEDYAVGHYIGAPFNPTNVWLVVDATTILYERLTYTATVDGSYNWLTNSAVYKIDEVVTIYTDSSKITVWGTLEIRTVDTHTAYLSPDFGVSGTFEGHGTGALEGVKVQGDNGRYMIGGLATRVREGIAMGWP